MNKKLLILLVQSGLDSKEARVYLALLMLGRGTVQEIARQSLLKRTTIYPILEKLQKRNLVAESKQQNKTYFIPEEPAQLLEKMRLRVDHFTKNLELFNSIRNSIVPKPKILFLNGSEGFKRIWQTIFKSGLKEYLIITDPREMLSFVQKGYITGRIIKEKTRLGIRSRQLIAFSEYAKEIIAKDKQENRISKVLPHIYKIPFTTIIFGNQTALISPSFEDVILIIESESFAKTQKSLFEALWDKLN